MYHVEHGNNVKYVVLCTATTQQTKRWSRLPTSASMSLHAVAARRRNQTQGERDGEMEIRGGEECMSLTLQMSRLMTRYQQNVKKYPGYMEKSMIHQRVSELLLLTVSCRPINICTDNKFKMHTDVYNDCRVGYSGVHHSRLCAIDICDDIEVQSSKRRMNCARGR